MIPSQVIALDDPHFPSPPQEEFVYLDLTKGGDEELLKEWSKPPPKPKLRATGAATGTITGTVAVGAGVGSRIACSCVLWVKAQGRNPGSVGNARNWPVTTQTPYVGAVVVTRESWAGHVALITAIEGDNLILSEANYTRCRVTHGRRLSINSKLIIGYN